MNNHKNKIKSILSFLNKLSKSGVTIQNSLEVAKYLSNFNDSLNVLSSAIDVIYRYFLDPEIIVYLYKDPEIDYEYVTICIRLDQYENDFLDTLRKAYDELLDILKEDKLWLLITTDFRYKSK